MFLPGQPVRQPLCTECRISVYEQEVLWIETVLGSDGNVGQWVPNSSHVQFPWDRLRCVHSHVVWLGRKTQRLIYKISGIAMIPPKDAATAMVCEAGWAVRTVL